MARWVTGQGELQDKVSYINQYNPRNRRPFLSYKVQTELSQPPRKIEMNADSCAGRHIETPKWTPIPSTRSPYIRGIQGREPTQVTQQCRHSRELSSEYRTGS